MAGIRCYSEWIAHVPDTALIMNTRRPLALAILFLFLFLAGCQEQPWRPLKVATNQWPGYAPLYLARYLQLFQSDIDMVQLGSNTEVLRAFRNGSVDVAAMTLDEALLLASQGEQLSVLMAMDFSNGADVVMAWPELGALENMRGKRVGVENTALGAIMLAAALERAGLAISDVELHSLPADQHAKAFLARKVDVVVTFEPVLTQLRKQGAVVLFDSGAVPDLIVDVLVARTSVLDERSVQLQDLVGGYYEARRYMITQPSDAYTYIAQRLQISSLELQQAYAGMRLPSLNDNIRWLEGDNSPFRQTVDQLFRHMQQRKLLQGDTVPHILADPRWLQAVRP